MYPNSIYFGPNVPIYRDHCQVTVYTIWVHGPLGVVGGILDAGLTLQLGSSL